MKFFSPFRRSCSPLLSDLARVIAILVCSGSLSAQQTFTTVKLADWVSVDGVAAVGTKGAGIALPVGSQLYHLFSETNVGVHIVTKPTFNVDSSDWATIDLGAVTLAFVRTGAVGNLLLVGDNSVSLPISISLDENGRSTDPLDIVLTFDQQNNNATVTIQKNSATVNASGQTGSIEANFSTGRTAGWTLDQLEVRAMTPLVANNGAASSTNAADNGVLISPPLATLTPAKTRKEASKEARALFDRDDNTGGEKILTDNNRNPKNTAEWHLESANELIQAAFSLARAGKPQKAAQIARLALEHTDQAARKAARQSDMSALAAAAEETSAFIHEKLLADFANAKSFYQSAALRNPDGEGARELRRLKRTELEGRRKAKEKITEAESAPLKEVSLIQPIPAEIQPATASADAPKEIQP